MAVNPPINQPVIGPNGLITQAWAEYFLRQSAGVTRDLTGYMQKATYDPTSSGSVTDSDALGGQSLAYVLAFANHTGTADLSQLSVLTFSYSISRSIADPGFYEFDATSGALSAYLPDAITNVGQLFVVMKVDASANAVTVSDINGRNINGSSTYSLASQWSVGSFLSNGSEWRVI